MRRWRDRLKSLKIRHRLFLILLLQALTFFLVGLVAINASFRIYDDQIYEESSAKFNLYSRSIQENLQQINDLSFTIISDRDIQRDLDTINRLPDTFESTLAMQNLQDKLLVHTKNQSFISGVDVFALQDKGMTVGDRRMVWDALDYDFVKRLAEEGAGRSVWGFLSRQEHTLFSVQQIKKIANLDLSPMGMIVIRIDLDKLVKDMDSATYSNSELLILSNNRIVYPNESAYKPEQLPLLEGGEGYRVAEIEGESYLLAYSTSPYTGWRFVNVVPFSSIIRNITIMKYILLGIYLALFLLVCLLGSRFNRSITQPIEKLSSKMMLARKGNFDLQGFDPPRNLDEVGRLDREFDRMIGQLDGLINENYIKQIILKETQYEALKSKINPHFLYNTLESINWMAKLNGQTQIAHMVKALGNVFRNSIDQREYVSLEEEIANLTDYIAIQKFRFEDRLDFRIEVEAELRSYMIPGLILQPIVENCIKYGLEQKKGVCEIVVSAEQSESLLILSVSDNGIGMDPDYLNKLKQHAAQPAGTGVGLRNIDDRIKLMFNESFGIGIESGPGQGTIVRITLPCFGNEG